MKVLFISNIPSPYRVLFFNELGKFCDLTVCFEGKTATDRNIQWKADGAKTYKELYLNGIRTGSDRFFSYKICRLLKQKWDHIVLGGYATPTQMLAILYLKRKKIPFILEADGGLINPESKYKYKIKRYFISSASAWFSSGKMTTDYFVHYGAHEDRCYVYPFTSLLKQDIDDAIAQQSCTSKATMRQKLGMTEQNVVLTVGRFTYDRGYGKGYDFILRAAEKTKNKDLGYYIIGDEPTEEFIKWKSDKELNHVHFVGFKKKNELADYYIAADAFVLMTRADVWGLVINEAMSFGLPVISTTRCVAACELIKNDENGYILDLKQADQLDKYICRLLENDTLCADFSKSSLQKILPYTIENMAKVHTDLLTKLQ